ncbi:MAG: MFS transporter [Gammaproteobacteria bacterium]|nr:MFS transporter [Gammaproteobacteria bacterium]
MDTLYKIMNIRRGEFAALGWAFGYFFCVLSSYYILRPIRDEMGIQGGVENLQWLFTATFIVMLMAVPLFGTAVARLPRDRLIPAVYLFFIVTIYLFFVFLHFEVGMSWAARAFFVWISVFNLFVVSIFWSFMVDVFSNEQAKRLFGVIAAGGSAGAIAGPALTVTLINWVGLANLLLVSIVFLCGALVCVARLAAWRRHAAKTDDGPRNSGKAAPIGGQALAGLVHAFRVPYLRGIAVYIVLYTAVSTFLYFTQANVVRDAFAEPEQRTTFFASIDLIVNGLTVLVQLFFTGRIVTRLGMAVALTTLPLLMMVGLLVLGSSPVLAVLALVQVTRRVVNYALTRPAREVLYTVVVPEDKYKTKNVTDTLVYRGGDALSAWLYAGLAAVGLSIGNILIAALPIALTWMISGWWLARRHDSMASTATVDDAEPITERQNRDSPL